MFLIGAGNVFTVKHSRKDEAGGSSIPGKFEIAFCFEYSVPAAVWIR